MRQEMLTKFLVRKPLKTVSLKIVKEVGGCVDESAVVRFWRWDVDANGWGSCPVALFGIAGVDPPTGEW